MSEKTEQTQDKSPESTAIDPESPQDVLLDKLAKGKAELDDGDIDSFLTSQDPEFAAQLKKISADKTLAVQEFEIDLALQELQEIRTTWQEGPLWMRAIIRVFPPLPRLVVLVRRFIFASKAQARSAVVRLRNFSFFLRTTGKDRAFTFLKKIIGGLKDQAVNLKVFVQSLSWRQRLAVLSLALVSVAAFFFVKWLLSSQVLTKQEKLFIAALDEKAGEVIQLPKEAEFEKFYDNLRALPNIVLLPRMIMVVQPSPGSAPQPMVAIELFIEAWNPDVIVEIKDREAFFRDFIQRHLESQEFRFFEQPELRPQLFKSLMNALNRVVSTGQLRSIRIKNIVLMPTPR